MGNCFGGKKKKKQRLEEGQFESRLTLHGPSKVYMPADMSKASLLSKRPTIASSATNSSGSGQGERKDIIDGNRFIKKSDPEVRTIYRKESTESPEEESVSWRPRFPTNKILSIVRFITPPRSKVSSKPFIPKPKALARRSTKSDQKNKQGRPKIENKNFHKEKLKSNKPPEPVQAKSGSQQSKPRRSKSLKKHSEQPIRKGRISSKRSFKLPSIASEQTFDAEEKSRKGSKRLKRRSRPVSLGIERVSSKIPTIASEQTFDAGKKSRKGSKISKRRSRPISPGIKLKRVSKIPTIASEQTFDAEEKSRKASKISKRRSRPVSPGIKLKMVSKISTIASEQTFDAKEISRKSSKRSKRKSRLVSPGIELKRVSSVTKISLKKKGKKVTTVVMQKNTFGPNKYYHFSHPLVAAWANFENKSHCKDTSGCGSGCEQESEPWSC